MRNKEFQKLLKKQKYNSNSGFTLTELLVGLFMSIFVVGALGFGLMTVLQTTQRENSKTAARNENSRALGFISDELRRASEIETDETNARTGTSTGQFDVTGKTVVLALNIPEVDTSATLGSDTDARTSERIIYYLEAASNNWKGPLVLYRWGPPLNANGNYTNGTWGEQVLLDGIDNTTVSLPCPAGTTTTPATPQGFYACITGTNTAQLFLTGQTKTASGVNDTQTNDSQVVARARAALAQRTDENDAMNWDVEGLGGSFNCKPPSTMWDMQTDFTSKDPDDPNNPSKTKNTSWTQTTDENRQAQPIEIDPEKILTITSSAVGKTGCINTPSPVSHTIDFGDPRTFNGDHETDDTQNASLVGSGDVVQFFKKGFNIPIYGGYNPDGGTHDPSQGDQLSLGQFLYNKGLAIPVDGGDPNDIGTTFKLPEDDSELQTYLDSSALETYLSDKYSNLSDAEKTVFNNDVEAFKTASKEKFKTLGDDQRIIGFEMGTHTDTTQPGFDLQDNIFVVTSSIFKKKFPACTFSGTCSSDDGGTDTGSE